MSQPYVGQIRLVGFNFAPVDWAFCDGSLLDPNQYSALFALIGTTYGGNGVTNFALPDLRGRVPVHMGQGASPYVIGQQGGAESITLITDQIPSHPHQALCSTGTATSASPVNNIWAADSGSDTPYQTNGPAGVAMALNTIGPAGGSQPHENRQPYQCINYIIALFGIYPSQN
jgi:microcystin-dependent protein